jgi:hypothetical protein
MRAAQGQELVTRDEPVRAEVYGEYARIQAAEKEAASSVTMLALVNRAAARLEIAPPTTEPINETKAAKPVVELTELPNEPAITTASEIAATDQETKPNSTDIVSAPAATSEASTDDNLSFPL